MILHRPYSNLTASLLRALVVVVSLMAVLGSAHAANDYGKPGPYKVVVLRRALCCDSKGKAFDLYSPTGMTGPAAVVTWGNGTFAWPQRYDYLLKHIASWGIVVVATRDRSVANGQTMLDALQKLAENRRKLPVKIDLTRAAAAGHSQGAGGSMNAMMKAGGQIITVLAFNLPGQQFCWHKNCSMIPQGMPSGTSVFFLSGLRDGLSPPHQRRATTPPYQSNKAYYDAVPEGRKKLRAAAIAANHNDVQGQPSCGLAIIGCNKGVEPYLRYTAAWLLWQLNGDKAAQSVFNKNGKASIFNDPRYLEVEGRL